MANTCLIGAMRPLMALSIYLAFVFFGAALIAPWAYAATQSLSAMEPFKSLASHSFHRFVSRFIEIFALIGLYPTARAMGLRSCGAIGVRPLQMSELVKGLAFGFVLLGALAGLSIAAHARELHFDQTNSEIWKHLRNAGLAALFAGVLEELIFRGVIFMGLRKQFEFWRAALLSSFIYAILHFLGTPASPPSVSWTSGFEVLASMFGGLADVHALIPACLNLTLLGCLLAAGVERTRTLYFSIGVHAALVFWVKTYGFMTHPVQPANAFWGAGRLIDGWACTLALTVAFLLVALFKMPRHQRHRCSQSAQ